MGFRRRWPGVSYGRGEDWHYVGDTGEPAFETGWDNYGGGTYPALAFRLREAGLVDVVGYVRCDGSGTTAVVRLPEGYRPVGAAATMPAIGYSGAGSTWGIQLAFVSTTGYLHITDSDNNGNRFHISGQFFLDAALAAP